MAQKHSNEIVLDNPHYQQLGGKLKLKLVLLYYCSLQLDVEKMCVVSMYNILYDSCKNSNCFQSVVNVECYSWCQYVHLVQTI